MSQYVDVEGMHHAARRMEAAAEVARDSANRMEEALHQFRLLAGSGYGNNMETLIELLRAEPAKTK